MLRVVLALLVCGSALWPVTVARAAARAGADFPNKERARIVIVQDQQRMLILDGDTLVKSFPISTGWPGKRQTTTPAWAGAIGEYWGTFRSFGTTQDDGYWLFTDYLPDGSWNGDILIHGAPYLLDAQGRKQYETANIGKAPVSHGCIQMLPSDMLWFRAWDPQGVAIEILPLTAPGLIGPKLALGAALVGNAQPAQAAEVVR